MTTEPLPLDLDVMATGRPAGSLADVGLTGAFTWSLFVPGQPVPQGSKKPMPIYAGSGPNRRMIKATMVEQRTETLKKWRAAVVKAAEDAWPTDPCESSILLGCQFLIVPWKSTKANDWPTGSRTGDLGKLVRAVEDALTEARVWKDDRLVVGYLGWPLTGKRFARPGEEAGCRITIRPAGEAVVAP